MDQTNSGRQGFHTVTVTGDAAGIMHTDYDPPINERFARVGDARRALRDALRASATTGKHAGPERRALSDAYVKALSGSMSETERETLLNWATLDAATALAILADRDGAP